MKMIVPLSSPEIGQEEKEAVQNVLESGILSIGKKVVDFEKAVAEYTGIKYAVAVNSGTSALNLIMKSLKIRPGDFFITTSFSFITSTNIILYEGAVPIFADINPKTYNIDVQSIEEILLDPKFIGKIKGIIPVDVFGQPADWDEISDIAAKNNLLIIEDSCEAIGAEYLNRKCGTFGKAGAFAFYPNKQITTGEGE